MDDSQKWAIACTREALEDYGYPERPLNTDRTAVILGNAMGGEKHYLTVAARVLPGIRAGIEEARSFAGLPPAVRRDIARELHERMGKHLPGDHGRQHARRTGELHRWPHRECLQLPRPELRLRCRLRVRHGGHQCGDRRAGRERLRRGGDRRDRPQHGRLTFVKFCKIGALSGDRHASVRAKARTAS